MARPWPSLHRTMLCRWPCDARPSPAMIACSTRPSPPPMFCARSFRPGWTTCPALLLTVGMIALAAPRSAFSRAVPAPARPCSSRPGMPRLEENARAAAAELARAREQLRGEVAQREQVESKLQRERSFMDVFMQSVPDAVYFKDLQSRFLKCSDSMACYFGKTSAARPDRQDRFRLLLGRARPAGVRGRADRSSAPVSRSSACRKKRSSPTAASAGR